MSDVIDSGEKLPPTSTQKRLSALEEWREEASLALSRLGDRVNRLELRVAGATGVVYLVFKGFEHWMGW